MTHSDEVSKATDLLVRPRLLEKLDSGRRIRLLCAPAGFGKSELARQFAARVSHCPLLWLDLQSTEKGLDQLQGRFAEVLDLDELSPSVEEVLKRQKQGLVVLDGYCPEKTTDKWLEHLFEHCPCTLQWLVCTRRLPSWRVGRWLLADELTLLDAEELALTVAETKLLLSQLRMSRRISAMELQRQSDGWIAGISLHLLSLQSGVDRAFGLLHRNALVQDYIDSEVLEHLPAEMLSLLCIIAQAPFVDAPLCAFLADDPMALRKLRREQVFLRHLSGSTDRFTLFEPLKRLLQERYPDQAAPLLAASQWLHLAGAHVEAFRYTLAIPDTSRGLVSVGQIALRELYSGQNLNYLLEGIDRLGLTWIEQNPQGLEVVSRALLLGGRLQQAERTIHLIAEQDIDLHLALSAELALHQGHAQEAQKTGYRALERLAENERWAQMILCFSCLSRASLTLGDVVTAKRLQHQGIELSRRKGETLFECLLMLDDVLIQELAGNLLRALQALDQFDQLLVQGPGSALLQGAALIRRGWLLILTGQERQARDALEEGLLLSCASRNPVACHAPAMLAQLDANNGDFATAQQRLADAQRLMHSWNVAEVIYRGVLDLCTVRIWMKADRYDSASRLLSRVREQYEGEHALTPPSTYPDLYALVGFLQAEVLCSRGSFGEASTLLDQLLQRAEGNAFNIIVCQAQHALAEVVRLRGDLHKAERLLASAAAMALRQGQHNLLMGPHTETLQLSLQAGPIAALPTAPAPEVELLSPRELAVLSLIAKGYSNVEIAKILSLSPYTVKTHAKHINSKLKVSSRTMATARAKALGLLL
ncbi:LuxR C-terminal-related transcriptional regulator [Pseudomonas japonica]|uniref:ATP-, maltotriose- and DNA-dependent transcriptional regulator MalT n=1 Tax=Pseudomonas japonica TaxID=256466 RepID=A0A239ECM8_9PSED|nr:LuxR C-terminal-related transcriptional regulator [Pseudomonas japonica]SNS41694.1 ATP-, maltotriose- and DNA-dependent transcriptional regulator MalT [Pseudomonas japonica]